jgi:multisubunit Na+/H+ antiporter MnhB subunit
MEIVVAIVILTTVLYILVKIIEMKYVQKEMRPMKELVRDAMIVGVSVCVSTFTVVSMNSSTNGFFNAMTDTNTLPIVAPVFTDNPGF